MELVKTSLSLLLPYSPTSNMLKQLAASQTATKTKLKNLL